MLLSLHGDIRHGDCQKEGKMLNEHILYLKDKLVLQSRNKAYTSGFVEQTLYLKTQRRQSLIVI